MPLPHPTIASPTLARWLANVGGDLRHNPEQVAFHTLTKEGIEAED